MTNSPIAQLLTFCPFSLLYIQKLLTTSLRPHIKLILIQANLAAIVFGREKYNKCHFFSFRNVINNCVTFHAQYLFRVEQCDQKIEKKFTQKVAKQLSSQKCQNICIKLY
jgi:hypothetical protein